MAARWGALGSAGAAVTLLLPLERTEVNAKLVRNVWCLLFFYFGSISCYAFLICETWCFQSLGYSAGNQEFQFKHTVNASLKITLFILRNVMYKKIPINLF